MVVWCRTYLKSEPSPLMCTIKNPTSDYIFINCFISLTCMQNFIDFYQVGFEIFSFLFFKKKNAKNKLESTAKKCESTQIYTCVTDKFETSIC